MTGDNHLENKQRNSERNEETPIVDRGPSKNKRTPSFMELEVPGPLLFKTSGNSGPASAEKVEWNKQFIDVLTHLRTKSQQN